MLVCTEMPLVTVLFALRSEDHAECIPVCPSSPCHYLSSGRVRVDLHRVAPAEKPAQFAAHQPSQSTKPHRCRHGGRPSHVDSESAARRWRVRLSLSFVHSSVTRWPVLSLGDTAIAKGHARLREIVTKPGVTTGVYHLCRVYHIHRVYHIYLHHLVPGCVTRRPTESE